MGLLDNAKRAAKKGIDAAGHHSDEAVLLQLNAMSARLTFYSDRVEMTNRLGTKREALPYGQVRAVKLEKSLGAAAPLGKKTLLITTGAGVARHEFKGEPLSKVQQAFDLINERIGSSGQPVASAASDADELAKLAELRDKGILTDEEFEAKKRQILGL